MRTRKRKTSPSVRCISDKPVNFRGILFNLSKRLWELRRYVVGEFPYSLDFLLTLEKLLIFIYTAIFYVPRFHVVFARKLMNYVVSA